MFKVKLLISSRVGSFWGSRWEGDHSYAGSFEPALIELTSTITPHQIGGDDCLMELNKILSRDDLPVWNQKVEGYLKQLPIYIQKDLPMRNHRKKLHTQPGIEMNITHEGSAYFVVGKKVYMQSARHIILFPGHYPHQVFPDYFTDYQRTVLCLNDLNFKADYSGLSSLWGMDWFTDQGCIHFTLSGDEYIKMIRILQSIEAEFMGQKIGWQRMLFSLFLELIVMLQRKYERYSTTKPSSSHIVDLCCKFVNENLYEDLSLQRVADLFTVSAEHLTRSFRRKKGLSFYQYVLWQRVLESKRLLCQNPNKTLTEIAYSLGFSSSTQFSRTFKSMTQETPSDFRRRMNRL